MGRPRIVSVDQLESSLGFDANRDERRREIERVGEYITGKVVGIGSRMIESPGLVAKGCVGIGAFSFLCYMLLYRGPMNGSGLYEDLLLSLGASVFFTGIYMWGMAADERERGGRLIDV